MTGVAVSVERPQHMIALEKANEIRFARKRTKDALAARETNLREILTQDPLPQYLHRVTVFEFLSWQHRVGRYRSKQACQSLEISPSRLVMDLTERQRKAIISLSENRPSS